MEASLVTIPLVAMGASLLTFISGFGLGTLLLPVFAVFFPLEVAILLTAIVIDTLLNPRDEQTAQQGDI